MQQRLAVNVLNDRALCCHLQTTFGLNGYSDRLEQMLIDMQELSTGCEALMAEIKRY